MSPQGNDTGDCPSCGRRKVAGFGIVPAVDADAYCRGHDPAPPRPAQETQP